MKHKMLTSILRNLATHAFLLSAAAGLMFAGAARGQMCELYPIALSASALTNVEPDTIIEDIWNGSNPGNFGWLSWTGDPGETTLVVSLLQPGDSATYANPDDPNDHQLNVGDWVSGKPGVANGKYIRSSLDALVGRDITVPIWDTVRGEGANTAYRVSGFAVIRILSYHLPSQNRIAAKFIGFTYCGEMPPT